MKRFDTPILSSGGRRNRQRQMGADKGLCNESPTIYKSTAVFQTSNGNKYNYKKLRTVLWEKNIGMLFKMNNDTKWRRRKANIIKVLSHRNEE